MRTSIKLAVLSALFVLVLGVGVAYAQTPDPSSPECYPVVTANCVDPNAANAGASASTGLPKTGTSSSIPTAVIAAGMIAGGSVLAIVARRRNAARRTLS